MKWLIDAQVPQRLAMRLVEPGYDAVQTPDLPRGNRTSDSVICRMADESSRILVSKDRDFLDSIYINGTPHRLLWVTMGNVTNNDLLKRFEETLSVRSSS